MRSLPRRSLIRLASTLAGKALIGVLVLADMLWPVLRLAFAPPLCPGPGAYRSRVRGAASVGPASRDPTSRPRALGTPAVL